jgi:hypothetical protein
MTRMTVLHRLPNALMYDDVWGQQTRTQRRDGPPLKGPLIETNGRMKRGGEEVLVGGKRRRGDERGC